MIDLIDADLIRTRTFQEVLKVMHDALDDYHRELNLGAPPRSYSDAFIDLGNRLEEIIKTSPAAAVDEVLRQVRAL